jgi:radical SAM superfamily enzyme YgiQ (UPF0313 family)
MAQVVIFTDSNGALGFGRYAGPYRIATELRQLNISVQVIEFFAEFNQSQLFSLINRHVNHETLWVGFSTTLISPNWNNKKLIELIKGEGYTNKNMIANWERGQFPMHENESEELLKYIKSKNKNIKLVIGGGKSHQRDSDLIDYYLHGEADNSVVALTQYLLKSNPNLKTQKINNTICIHSSDYPVDTISSIKWHESDHIYPNEHLPIEISRGCVFKCKYCSFKNLGRGSDELIKSLDAFTNEVNENYQRFGTTGYMFSDDTFNDSREKVFSYAKAASSLDFELEWAGYCRADLFYANKDTIPTILETGLRFANFGIETLNQKAGAAVGKGLSPQKTKDTLYKLKDTWGDRVIISCNFIVGLRHESEESIWETYEWLVSDDSPVDSFNFHPLYLVHDYAESLDQTAKFTNELGLMPHKYGYLYNPDNGYWKHELMDRDQAFKIVDKIYTLKSTKNKTLANRSGFYSRLRNLSFDYQDLRNETNSSNNNFLEEIARRKENVINDYFLKVTR